MVAEAGRGSVITLCVMILMCFLYTLGDSVSRDDFPDEFVFGTASSAFQVLIHFSL